MPPKPRLLPSMRANLRLRHFSPRTEEAYLGWTRRFVRFHDLRHPSEIHESGVKVFLVHLLRRDSIALAFQRDITAMTSREHLTTALAGRDDIEREISESHPW